MGLPTRFSEPDSVDNWRHTRMLDMTRPVYECVPGSRWMTVGDGRYGSDAAYLKESGVYATATSLTDESLRASLRNGWIDGYRAENAEQISYRDDEFDFVLCKEAYHHFPRPPIALYEMLRVARIGVVLVEPIDSPKLLDALKRLIKRVIRGDREHQFEKSGNFLFRTSIREIEKLQLAMGGTMIASKGLNDFYLPALSGYRANQFNYGYLLTRLGIFVQDVLVRLHLLGYGLAGIIVFKRRPDDNLLQSLKSGGYTIVELPENPYS